MLKQYVLTTSDFFLNFFLKQEIKKKSLSCEKFQLWKYLIKIFPNTASQHIVEYLT